MPWVRTDIKRSTIAYWRMMRGAQQDGKEERFSAKKRKPILEPPVTLE
jgi:hypothetical protein